MPLTSEMEVASGRRGHRTFGRDEVSRGIATLADKSVLTMVKPFWSTKPRKDESLCLRQKYAVVEMQRRLRDRRSG